VGLIGVGSADVDEQGVYQFLWDPERHEFNDTQEWFSQADNFGKAVAVTPSGLWGFMTSDNALYVIDIQNRSLAWTLTHNSTRFDVYFQNDNSPKNSIPDCTLNNSIFICELGPSLRAFDGGVVLSLCAYESTFNEYPSELPLICQFYFNESTGEITHAGADVSIQQLRYRFYEPLDMDAVNPTIWALTLCRGTRRRCNEGVLYTNEFEMARTVCPFPQAVSRYADMVAVGCPQENAVGTVRLVQLQYGDEVSPLIINAIEGYIGFGSSVGVSKENLFVGAENAAALYRLTTFPNGTVAHWLELYFPNYDSPSSPFLAYYQAVFLSDDSVLVLPNSLNSSGPNALAATPLRLCTYMRGT